MKQTVFYLYELYGCTTFTSRVNVIYENTLSEPKVSKALYI